MLMRPEPAATADAGPLRRYTGVAMTLHWAIALAVLLLLASGLVMTRMGEGPLAYSLFQWHKALGVTVFALTLARIGWRLANPPPPLPDTMTGWERTAAKLGHAGFYVLLVALPLGGWALVSVSTLNIPTTWFGLFGIPHLPAPESLETRQTLEALFIDAHAIGGYVMLALVAVHVGAALRHALILKDGTLTRMLPSRAPTLREVAAVSIPVLALVAVLSLRGQGETATATPAATPAPTAVVASANGWTVDMAASALGFTGSQMGAAFTGRFERFTAEIAFDPAAPESGRALVVVDTGSARTGDGQKDKAMPGADWFDVGQFPEARFEATTFRRTGPDAFEAVGTLTIRGVTQPLILPFTLAPEGDASRARGSVQLIRTDFGVGQGQWSSGNWVALEVTVTVDLLARRPG